MPKMPAWLSDAVFYEIYPQSFYDSNGDGIGDINGITAKLDYIQALGCNAIWINPCFDSPFKDAGYDVRDYYKVAPRYGTNEDLSRCFSEAHARGMHILLDLVPGHTSEEHPWFQESRKAEKNAWSNRYIWTDHCFASADGLPFVGGESERSATYVLNFFKCQPALNYGFYRPSQPWQLPMDHPDCIATRKAMQDVMRFWLDKGCDGFRVDMASSLVKKDDAVKSGTCAIWREVRQMLDTHYPEAAIIAEWGQPELSLKAGFHMDFVLNDDSNGYESLMRDYRGTMQGVIIGPDRSYFSRDGGGDVAGFLRDYLPQYQQSKDDGLFCLITCNHDTIRPRGNLSPEELKLAYAFLFTMPGAPFLYYGDEIGMRYQKLPTHEGGYFRTGSRTPMQWAAGKNLGFSTAEADSLYLPVDPSADAPTVSAQEGDSSSLLETVRALLALRHAHQDLSADSPFSVFSAEPGSRLFAYRRGGLVCAVNPGAQPASFAMAGAEAIYTLGSCRIEAGEIILASQSFAVLRTKTA